MTEDSSRENEKDPMFQPLRIKHLTFKNRIMSTSHASGMDDQGMPAERYPGYHEEKAMGGLALTMLGGSSNMAPDSPRCSTSCALTMIESFRICSRSVHAAPLDAFRISIAL